MGFPAQLPDELITEFGQIVWMAINLEDVTYFICHAVKPRAVRRHTDRDPYQPGRGRSRRAPRV